MLNGSAESVRVNPSQVTKVEWTGGVDGVELVMHLHLVGHGTLDVRGRKESAKALKALWANQPFLVNTAADLVSPPSLTRSAKDEVVALDRHAERALV